MRRIPRVERADETDIAFGVLVVASCQPSGLATFRRLHLEIPIHVRLSPFDLAESVMNHNEPNWVQRLRSIRANAHNSGNFVHEGYLIHLPRVGYRITPLGLRRRMYGRYGHMPAQDHSPIS